MPASQKRRGNVCTPYGPVLLRKQNINVGLNQRKRRPSYVSRFLIVSPSVRSTGFPLVAVATEAAWWRLLLRPLETLRRINTVAGSRAVFHRFFPHELHEVGNERRCYSPPPRIP